MKALVLHGQDDLRYEDVETPEIKEDEVLVKVMAAGVCGSDIPRVLGTAAHYYPIILGHEFSGEAASVGSSVSNIKPGDRVTCAPLVPCLKCEDCQQGYYSQCKNYTFIGSRINGSWAEYVKVPAINVVKLPDGVDFIQGAFFEPLTVALHGLMVMGFKSFEDTAVIGMGTIGLLALQALKALGARRVTVFDIDEERLKAASQLGADCCINTGSKDLKDEIKQVTNGRGFKQVVETAGVEFTEKLSLEAAGNKGSVMFIGTPSKSISLLPREFEHINRKELTVRGSWMSYSAPFPGAEWELAGHFFRNGSINSDKLIDRVIPMEDARSAFDDLKVPGKVKGKIIMKG